MDDFTCIISGYTTYSRIFDTRWHQGSTILHFGRILQIADSTCIITEETNQIGLLNQQNSQQLKQSADDIMKEIEAYIQQHKK